MRGLVVGKFYPPHAGHHFLIDTALNSEDSVDVLIVDNPAYGISAEKRMQWLSLRHPSARMHIIKDINDDDNSEAWAKHTIKLLGYAPDTVYSSEEYGKNYAKFMGAKHYMVDHSRTKHSVSGTIVRSDLLKHWSYLEPAIKKDLAIRIVVLGAESTGTTTLTKALAEKYETIWVPELGRSYAEGVEFRKKPWADDDFIAIAKLQQSYENELASLSEGIIICDTNATATQVWQRRYMGKSTAEVERIAEQDKADLFIITGPEIPFVKDSTRDGEHVREQMHQWFIDMLAQNPVQSIVVTGSVKDRLNQATPIINQIVESKKQIIDTL